MRNLLNLFIFTILSNNFLTAQGYFESLDDNADYMYFGLGFQSTHLKSSYYLSGATQDDWANGIQGVFAWEEYGKNSSGWMKMDCSQLLDAAISAISKYRGLSLKRYNKEELSPKGYKGYLLNGKFIHAQGSFSVKSSRIGPVFSLGWEGVGLVEQLGNKGGEFSDGVGEGNIGLISFGTGINWLQPLSILPPHSRITLSYDWFLNRKNADKFWIGGAARGRISLDFSMVLARRLTAYFGYSFFNFINAYSVTIFENNTTEERYYNARLSTFKLGFAYNIIAK